MKLSFEAKERIASRIRVAILSEVDETPENSAYASAFAARAMGILDVPTCEHGETKPHLEALQYGYRNCHGPSLAQQVQHDFTEGAFDDNGTCMYCLSTPQQRDPQQAQPDIDALLQERDQWKAEALAFRAAHRR